MVRLREAIEDDSFSGVYRQYPLLDDLGRPLWKDKFKTQEDIERERKKVPSESAWQREYLLKIVPDEDRVVRREWLNYYDKFPEDKEGLRYIATGIDLAISEKATASCTAMVSAYIYGREQNIKIYILPHPVNKRMDFPLTQECAKSLSISLGGGVPSLLFIEEVAYQASFIQTLQKEGFHAEGVKPHGQDKKARLTLTTPYIKNANILFPKKGCKDLIGQLVNFGYEKHDDLAVAF